MISYIPKWWLLLCLFSSILSSAISMGSIVQQFFNYRKPFEQRLVVRIQLMVPLFSATCLLACLIPQIAQIWIDPIREIYESFVIYTFFSLLTLILGGERKIITELSIGKAPIRHPIPFFGRILPVVDMSDPRDFLSIKRGILQYVWFKPLYCIGTMICMQNDWYPEFWIPFWTISYNISASLSLYNLALFWKCLYTDLQKYNPWPKFLCVKLIIFASYWQGTIIAILSKCGVINHDTDVDYGYVYQNAVLCVEMIGFALGHLVAFNWSAYSSKSIPEGSRIRVFYALRDCFGFGDLVWDFKVTFLGNLYNYRHFNSAEAVVAHRNARSRLGRLQAGFRYSDGGRSNYWVNDGELPSQTNPAYGSIENNEPWIDLAQDSYIPEDPNYPVIWDVDAYKYSRDMEALRQNVRRSYLP
ncbi:LANO_0G05270g1_1 [Lachancea nothofagi CBS 11611]|uniref:LANO_0G05270g1_1 n=1 Tax=Lachancea nothofagi CBS 11611 TaxID=1266666 RepID=A0A1G4KGI4_9SACH|nr:LANO_0G05270g1_1 [Lachancea nothofagi CBS 11611]